MSLRGLGDERVVRVARRWPAAPRAIWVTSWYASSVSSPYCSPSHVTRSTWLIRNASSSGRAEPVDHDVVVVLQPRPRRGAALDQLDDQHGVHRAPRPRRRRSRPRPAGSGRRRARTARPRRSRRGSRSSPARISGVSMLPPCASGTSEERTSHAGRRDADRAVHRIHRQLDAEVAVARPRTARCRCVRSTLVDPDRSRAAAPAASRCGRVAGQRAEERDGRRRGPVPGRLDRDEVQRERVAGLGALDVERAGLRVEGGDRSPRARSSTARTRPAKQSSVHTSSTSPGLTFITGSTPPKVHA